MNKWRLATVFMVTVGGVLIPGVANAATSTTTVTSGASTATVDPIFVLAGGSTTTTSDGSTGASAPTVTDVSPPADSSGVVVSGKDGGKGPKDGAKPVKDAGNAPKPDKPGPVKHDTTLTSSTLSWTGDASLFDGQGRKFG